MFKKKFGDNLFFIYVCAAMKSAASYISLSLLLCAYLVTNMGIEVHKCTFDGSIQIMLMAGQVPCQHGCCCKGECSCGNTGTHIQKEACGCHKHGDHCCQSHIYTIEDDQNTVDDIKIIAPTSVSNLFLHHSFGHIYTFHYTATLDICAANIVFGPSRGLSTCAPLRC